MALPAIACPPGQDVEAGLRAGEDSGLDLWAIYARWDAPLIQRRVVERYLPDGVDACWDVTVGHWSGDHDDFDLLAFGPAFGYPLAERLQLSVGLQPSLLSGANGEDRNLGGTIQFTSHIGLAWHALSRVALSLRVRHTSNGGIYGHNPGVDGVMLGVGYRF